MKKLHLLLLLTINFLQFTNCLGEQNQQPEGTGISEYSILSDEDDRDAIVLSYREFRLHGFYIQFFGPTGLGVNYDYHVADYLDLEFGLGIGLDIQLGVRYHPIGDVNFSPYIGIFITRIRAFHLNLFEREMEWGPENAFGIYIPIGLEVYTNTAFTLLLEGAYNYSTDRADNWD